MKLFKQNGKIITKGGKGIRKNILPNDYDWHWNFESQYTSDDSGNGYDGCFYSSTELGNATYPSGMIGSYSFSANPTGSNDRTGLVPAQHTGDPIDANITSKYTIKNPDAFTACFKYKANTTPNWTQYLFEVQYRDELLLIQSTLRLSHITSNKLVLHMFQDYPIMYDNTSTGSTTLNNGQEYSIIITYDGDGDANIYLNGSLECSLSFNMNFYDSEIIVFNIGEDWLGGAADGELDAVYFYPRVLTNNERTIYDNL